MTLPKSGRAPAELLGELAARRADDLVTGASALAYSYDAGLPELSSLAREAHSSMLGANGLDPTAFPSVVGLENEVVAAVSELLGGGPEHAGTFTSGGTESIMLAVKAARDSRPDVERPKLVKASTGHPAFVKAAHYLGVEVVNVDVDPTTFRADPETMAAAIGERTVLVIASAPSYAHGVLDPVGPIAAAAAEVGALCHVDACVGGFMLPFQVRLGEGLEPFDLSVKGVTSISADLHKYGYAPKGASVIVFRDAELRRASYFAAADWPGYTVINAAVQSTKSGGPVAAAWATLQHLGLEGYDELARRSVQAARALRIGITNIDGVRVLGDPITAMLAVAGDGVDILQVADELGELGTFAQVQLSHGSSPVNIHLSTYGPSLDAVDDILATFAQAVAAAQAADPVEVPDDLSSQLATLDGESLTPEVFEGLVAATGVDLSGGRLGRLATVNHLLDAAPAELRELLLERFLGALFTPRARPPPSAPRRGG